MSGMGIEMARQSIKEARDKVKAHLAARKKAKVVMKRLFEKKKQLEDELKEQGVNIEEAVIKYIEVEEDPGMFEEEFVDFEKTKKLVNLREQILIIRSNIERIDKDLVTQADASETLMKRYPALRGGRKTRKKRKSRRRKRKKNKTKRKRKRKRRKTKRR